MHNLLYKSIAVIIAMFSLFCLSSCTKINEDISVTTAKTTAAFEPFPVEVYGENIEQAPATVISLSPALTEILFEIGVGGNVVGRSEYCDYPQEVSNLQEYGSSANPNFDMITKSSPELLISQSPIAKKDVTLLEKHGISVIIFKTPTTADEINELYLNLNKIFYGELPTTNENVENYIQPFKSDKSGNYLMITSTDLTFASTDSLISNLLSSSFNNLAGEKTSLTVEEISALSPDFIILPNYLSVEDFSEEFSAIPMISLSEDVQKLLERPTSRVSAVANFIDDAVFFNK